MSLSTPTGLPFIPYATPPATNPYATPPATNLYATPPASAPDMAPIPVPGAMKDSTDFVDTKEGQSDIPQGPVLSGSMPTPSAPPADERPSMSPAYSLQSSQFRRSPTEEEATKVSKESKTASEAPTPSTSLAVPPPSFGGSPLLLSSQLRREEGTPPPPAEPPYSPIYPPIAHRESSASINRNVDEDERTTKAKALGETIFAVCQVVLAIILLLVLVKVTAPLAIGMAIYLKTPLAVLPIALSAVNIYCVCYFAMKALRHIKNAWNFCNFVS